MAIFDDSLIVRGAIDMQNATSATYKSGSITNDAVSASANFARSKLALDELKPYPVDLSNLRIHDAYQTLLTTTSPTADDLTIQGGTFGSGAPTITTVDVKATSGTKYARFMITLPAEYDAAETVNIDIYAGAETTVADTSMAVDLEVYEIDGTGAVGSDLCATTSQSINSLTYATKTFSITATGLVAGDVLDCRVAITWVDAATATAVIGSIGRITLKCDVRG